MIILLALLFGVAARGVEAQAVDDQAPNPAATREYVVQPGDTLTRIAENELGSAASVDRILALNPRLTDRHLIRFGDRILLPGAPRKSQSSANPQSPAKTKSQGGAKNKNRNKRKGKGKKR